METQGWRIFKALAFSPMPTPGLEHDALLTHPSITAKAMTSFVLLQEKRERQAVRKKGRKEEREGGRKNGEKDGMQVV